MMQKNRGNFSSLLRWERLGATEWRAANTLSVVTWSGAGQGYTVTHPTSGALLRLGKGRGIGRDPETVRIFGRPEDAKAAARRIREKELRDAEPIPLIETAPYDRLRA